MRRRILHVVIFASLLVLVSFGTASATAYDLHFTNDEVNVASLVSMTNEYSGYGLTFQDVYKYVNASDYWGASDLPYGLRGSGIANGNRGELYQSNTDGRVNFLIPATFISIDYWIVNPGGTPGGLESFYFYDAGGNLIDPGTPSTNLTTSGTLTFYSPAGIGYFIFKDDGGYVTVSNLRYATPEPGTLLLLGSGLLALVVVGQRHRGRQGK